MTSPRKTRLPTEARQRQIADAALVLIADGGPQRLTAAELARAVGLADGSLFRHFPSMDAIVLAAVDRFEEHLDGSLTSEAADPIERLRDFFVHRQALLRERPHLMRLAFNDRLLETASPAAAERIRAGVARSRAFIRACLADALAAGRVRADVPAEALAWTVVGFMRGAALQAAASPAPPSPEVVWTDLLLMLSPPGGPR